MSADGRAGEAARTACAVCPHRCRLAPGARGRCRARVGTEAGTRAENYGRVTSLALDPIEKKPIARFMPGTWVLSAGSYGCNLVCPFCQNHEISQAGADDVPWRTVTPEELVDAACTLRADHPLVSGIAYTYNEPLVGWEFVRDCAALAHERGLVNVLVSNGVATEGVVRALAGLIDAANIDLKAFSPDFYRACGGGDVAFACARRTVELLAQDPVCHLEVTTLVVPGMNDDEDMMDEEARWLAGLACGGGAHGGTTCGDGARGADEIVLHVTRFFGRWRMADAPPTPRATVRRLADVARRHLRHVYTGNL